MIVHMYVVRTCYYVMSQLSDWKRALFWEDMCPYVHVSQLDDWKRARTRVHTLVPVGTKATIGIAIHVYVRTYMRTNDIFSNTTRNTSTQVQRGNLLANVYYQVHDSYHADVPYTYVRSYTSAVVRQYKCTNVRTYFNVYVTTF
jgi:hypothetical protein